METRANKYTGASLNLISTVADIRMDTRRNRLTKCQRFLNYLAVTLFKTMGKAHVSRVPRLLGRIPRMGEDLSRQVLRLVLKAQDIKDRPQLDRFHVYHRLVALVTASMAGQSLGQLEDLLLNSNSTTLTQVHRACARGRHKHRSLTIGPEVPREQQTMS